MLSESEKRAAQLAVSRYGVDRAKIQQAIHTILEARANGQGTDFFDHLLSANLLSPSQAQDLRLALDVTQIDPHSPKNRPTSPEEGKTEAPQTNGYQEDLSDLQCLGEFRILRRLGEGGMGSVFLGYQETEGRQVAIKVLTPQMANSQTSVDRFYREARSGAALNHPNIVRNLAVAQDQETGYHYIVLEFVDGPSAQALLESSGRLAVSDAVHIVLDIARALEHVHSRNIVHRDIKPANILITQSGVAKLADLGLAKRTDEASHLTAARQGFGTPFYMPYEQALNAKKADGRSDIYALGATLYHLVTGMVPFSGNNHLEIVEKKNLGFFTPASAVNRDIPPALDRILQKMLARRPEDRYQTASELIVDLERANLAAAVPSFVDPDRAMQDPLVRQRLTLAAQPTSLAVNVPPGRGAAGDATVVWFVRFQDDVGKWCKVKGTLAQIHQRLREGKLPLNSEVSQAVKGEYRPLACFPEFRDFVPLIEQPSLAKDKGAPLGTTEEFLDPYRSEDTQATEREVLLPRWVFWGLAAGIALLVTTVIMRLFVFPF